MNREAPGVRIVRLSDEKAATGEVLDLSSRLIRFAFEDDATQADRAIIQLDNFDLELFERDEVMAGTLFEVTWGHSGQMTRPRRVLVKSIRGFSQLTVEAEALSLRLNKETKMRSWLEHTRSEVAQQIAADYGYVGAFIDIESTEERFDVITQNAETDAQFIKRLATREGFEFYIDVQGLHFHRQRQQSAPTHVFTWYGGEGKLLNVHLGSDVAYRTGKVTVRGRDPLAKITLEASTTANNVERTALSDVIEVVDPESGQTHLEFRNATSVTHPTAVVNEVQVERESQARFRKAEQSSIQLSIRVVGDPTLAAKQVIEMRGISSYLSGKYYVQSVRHVLADSGYVSELKLTRDGVGRKSQSQVQPRPQVGPKNTLQPQPSFQMFNNFAPIPHGGVLTPIQGIDPETGQYHIEYHRKRQFLGQQDPEGGQ